MRHIESLAVACVLAAAAPAYGGTLQCRSHTITEPDARNALHAATRQAGNSRIIKSSLSVCMNPGRGRAWYDAEPEPQPDGSVIRPSVLCYRQTGRWRCEVLKRRTANINGLEFALPVDLDIGAARKLVAHAFELAPELVNSQECGWKSDRTQSTDGTKKPDGFGEAYASDRADRWLEIMNAAGGGKSVIVDSNTIYFLPDGEDWKFSCWGVMIIVS